MNYGTVAALLRGLYIDLTGKPQFVIFQKHLQKDAIPSAAMKIELTGADNEEAAASRIRNAYKEWKNSNTVSDTSLQVPVPGCTVLTANGNTEALFWTGTDFDSARKRLAGKDASPLAVIQTTNEGIAAQRASVVKNKIALITGGAQGIGEEIVRNLASAGALVFIADLNLDGARKLADEINNSENRIAALAVKVDVSSEESAAEMFDTVAETAGGLDLCISNAGVLKAGSVLEQKLSDFKFVTDINYTGFFVISKFAGQLLRIQHLTAPGWKTDIIQVNSKSGLEGSNKNGAYAGGKFGGLGLTASFAMELIEYGIKVNAVCPGNFLDGPLWSDPEKGLFVQYLRTGKVPGAKSIADVRTFYESKVPMKRGCTGTDLIRAIFYIVEQEYETGQAVPVTGGQIMLH